MQLPFDFPVTPRFSLANFVVCSGNETAYRFALRLLEPTSGENLLYLHGPEGSGKTHLLMALADALGERTGKTVPCLTFGTPDSATLPARCVGTGNPGDEVFREAPALLVDDLHLIPADHDLRIALWQLFNDYYQTGRPMVITGRYPPKELPNLDDHLTSRLLWGLVAHIDVSDDSSRRMIMQKLALDRQMVFPDEVVDYLLRHARRDIPSLIDTLDRIVHHALATGRKVSLRLASEVMAPNGAVI
ncbi:MAG: DnaA regulatory inactivator Hda [Geobacter sp.]|nr:DnaA regulatory inactivator Hda [Geobacter sp.]